MPSEREVEAAARAMVVSDEQNGGPPWEYIMGLGKHAVEPLYERARAALSAAAAVRKEEGLRQLASVIDNWPIGTYVEERFGSFCGYVCGYYSTEKTPVGYVVNSKFAPGAVQVWPESALERKEEPK
jgi:hypothetical protein